MMILDDGDYQAVFTKTAPTKASHVAANVI